MVLEIELHDLNYSQDRNHIADNNCPVHPILKLDLLLWIEVIAVSLRESIRLSLRVSIASCRLFATMFP